MQTINDIIKLKEELNRDKDKKDLLAINSAKTFYLHELKLLIYEVVKIININITDRKVIEDILDEIMYISYFDYKEAYQVFDLLINYYSKIDKNRALIYINNMKELNNEKNIIKYLVK